MPRAQQLIAEAAYSPAALQLLGEAFDDAWAVVAPNYTSKLAVEAARLKLANIVLTLAAEGVRDPLQLKDRAVRTLSVDNP